METVQTAEQKTVAAFGMKNPRTATITRDVKTKLGLAFRKGDALVTVYESGIIETGPYAGQMGYSAYSIRNKIMTAIRPASFKFESLKAEAEAETAYDFTPNAEQIKRTVQEWSALAGEPIEIKIIGTFIYALGSELACLRLAFKFLNSRGRVCFCEGPGKWSYSHELFAYKSRGGAA